MTQLFFDNCPQKKPEGKTSATDKGFIIIHQFRRNYNWLPFIDKPLANIDLNW